MSEIFTHRFVMKKWVEFLELKFSKNELVKICLDYLRVKKGVLDGFNGSSATRPDLFYDSVQQFNNVVRILERLDNFDYLPIKLEVRLT